MQFRKYLFATAGSAAVLIFASLGAAEAATIRYVVPASTVNYGAFQSNIDAWEQKSGNTVEVQAIPDAQYDNVVLARLAGNEGIDIFLGQDNVADPASAMIEADESAFASRLAASSLEAMRSADGKIYGYPGPEGLETYGVFYNKDVFAAAGVEVPTTLAELTAAFEKIKAAGVTPLFLSGKDGWTLLQHRNALNGLLSLQIEDAYQQIESNQLTWSASPYFKEEYDALVAWNTSGLVNDGLLTATYEEAKQAVANGTAAAIINGTWVIGEIYAANPEANIGFFPLPTPDGKVQIALSRPSIVHIAASSEVKEEAKDLLLFLGAKEQAEAYLAAAPGVPPFNDVELADVDPVVADVQRYAEAGTARAFDQFTKLAPATQDGVVSIYQELLGGRITVEEFGGALDSLWAQAGKAAGLAGF